MWLNIKVFFVVIALLSAVQSLTFDCYFGDATWTIIGTQYSCTADITGSGYDLLDVTGDHRDGSDNSDVRILEVYNQQVLLRLPNGITTFFPNLVGMQWSYGVISSLTSDDLQPFSGLQVLGFSNNLLVTLDGNLFQHTPNLGWISFFNNLLQTVGENILGSLNELQVVHFGSNPCIDAYADNPSAIEELNRNLPIQCPALVPVIIQCEFRDVTWTKIGTQYGCGASLLTEEGGRIVIDVTGDHVVGNQNSDVRILDVLNDELLERLPIGIDRFFPNLIGMQWAIGALSTISAEDLQTFPDLQVLGFAFNRFVTLDGNLFQYNPNLMWISFYENLLQNIGLGLLTNLNQLQVAHFGQNPCIDFLAETPEEMAELIELLPVQCPPLDFLIFECIFYEVGWAVIGYHYSCIGNIIISGSPTEISNVTGTHWTGRDNSDVRSIDVEYQFALTSLPPNLNDFFPNLIGIQFYVGTIDTLTAEDLRPFADLQVLSFSYNNFASLDGNIFQHTTNLAWISFADNQLRNVGNGLLNNLNQLQYVNFQHNFCIDFLAETPAAIEELRRILPIQCPPLEFLEFECVFDNANWVIVGPQYSCIPTIRTSGNFHTLTHVTGTHLDDRQNSDVTTLNVIDQHVLSRIPSGIDEFFPNIVGVQFYIGELLTLTSDDLRQFPNLQVLGLSYNNIVSLSSNLFQHTPRLAWLSLYSNLLQNVGFNLLGGLSELVIAQFGNNPCINFYGNTPQTIEELNRLLPMQCPPVEPFTFNCVFRDITWDIIGTQYGCDPTIIGGGDRGYLVGVTGNHLDDRNNADVRVLDVQNQEVFTLLPIGIEAFFHNLIGMQWNIGGLNTITAADLRPFPNLQVIGFAHNNFAVLDGNLFEFTPSIAWISFFGNLITNTGDGLLSGLNDLQIANFGSNPCIDLNANTPELIEELIEQLPIQCPDPGVIVFDCFFYFDSWVNIGTQYSCYADVTRTGDQTSLTHVSGTHMAGQSNSDVGTLDIQFQFVLERIPRNINQFFPNLNGIQFYFGTLTTLTSEDLAPFTNLQVLGLTYNNIVSLDANVFQHTPRISWLSLYGNELQSVAQNLFSNLPSLNTAYFGSNPCIDFDANTRETVLQLELLLPLQCPLFNPITFHCTFRQITWAVIGSQYGCDSNIIGTGFRTSLAEVTGDHSDGNSNSDVRILDVHDQQLTRLTRDIESFFDNLIGLQWYVGELTTITAEELAPFTNLQVISFALNNIMVLDGNLFNNNANLAWISFYGNIISHIGRGIFTDLNQLEVVNIGSNTCIDFIADTPALIEELIEELPIQCPPLEFLVFHCTFSDDSWVIVGTQYSCSATISSTENMTRLTNVTGFHLGDRENEDVRTLNVINQQVLTSIPRDIELFFPNLVGIQFYNGALETLTAEDLQPFPSLRVLGLSYNWIVSLEGNLFQHNPQLAWMSFYGNELENVGRNLIGDLPELVLAQFENNPCINFYANSPALIQELNLLLPLQCPFIEPITFHCTFREITWAVVGSQYGCDPTIIGTGDRTILTEVTGDHLEGNDDSSVRILDVQNHQLDNLPFGIEEFFQNLIAMQWNLGEFTFITAEDLRPFPNLQVLGLANNNLVTLNGNLFQHNPNLAWISLFGNLLENIGRNLLTGLNQLEMANFGRNPCIDFVADSPALIGELIDELPIQCPPIEFVVFDCYFSNVNWVVIGFQYGCAPNIRVAGGLTSLTNVTGSHLGDNSNLDVTVIDVQNQQFFTSIPSDIELFFPNLIGIQFYNGALETLTAEDLQPFPSLRVIGLSYNWIVSLDGNLFQHNPQLAWMSLYGNELENVGHNLIGDLSELTLAQFENNPCINFYAYTPELIQELNLLLPIQCPPLLLSPLSPAKLNKLPKVERCEVHSSIDSAQQSVLVTV